MRLKLSDGTTIENGTAGLSQGFLWLWFTGYTFSEAAGIFLDPNKTARIIYEYGEMEDEYVGFINCVTIQIDVDGRVSVCLKKGE